MPKGRGRAGNERAEVHAQVEEEIFYPAVKKAIESSELVDEAKKEHQEAKSLISQLKKTSRQDDGEGSDFEAKFSELMQAIKHHVEEEEGEMFPQVEDSELDLSALGAQMTKRKQEITKSAGSKRQNPETARSPQTNLNRLVRPSHLRKPRASLGGNARGRAR